MKRFLYRLTFIAGMALVLMASSFLFTNQFIGKHAKIELDKSKSMLVIGHSHSECAFNDSLIVNSSNISSSAESYFYNYYKILAILKQNKQLKTVFIGFSNNQVDEVMDDWTWDDRHLQNKYKTYAPFIDLEGTKLLYTKNPNGLIGNFGASVFHNLYVIASGSNLTKKIGGYLSLVMTRPDTIPVKEQKGKEQYSFKKTSAVNLHYLKAIINKCKAENINVYLVRSPLHKEWKYLRNEQVFQRVLRKEFSATEFLDFKDFPLADSDFADSEHLNFRGARKFSLFFNRLLDEKMLLRADKEEFIKAEILKVSERIANGADFLPPR